MTEELTYLVTKGLLHWDSGYLIAKWGGPSYVLCSNDSLHIESTDKVL
jgi:hypothetical protein